jgi:hypothetical protein
MTGAGNFQIIGVFAVKIAKNFMIPLLKLWQGWLALSSPILSSHHPILL